jgi:hypothetical protein
MFRFELKARTGPRNAGEVSEIRARSQISVADCKAYRKDKSHCLITLYRPTLSLVLWRVAKEPKRGSCLVYHGSITKVSVTAPTRRVDL